MLVGVRVGYDFVVYYIVKSKSDDLGKYAVCRQHCLI